MLPLRPTTHSAVIALGLCLIAASISSVAGAQPATNSGPITHDVSRERVLLQKVKTPDGLSATLFAALPGARSPVCLTATIQGALFVCVDPSLSPTAPGTRGRVVRLVDDNHDGLADRYSVFAEMDNPRGLAYDGKTLYVMHPPNLTAYRDTTGDGVADVSEDIVTGLESLANGRGAPDDTPQGITIAVDGFIYIGVGKYGFQQAVGKDGTTISHRGGGVVRVRTDGTGLELYAEGTRNIHAVAVDPMLRVFAHDDTTDGDGWDGRLHYLPPGAHMGYPMYFKNFRTEHMQSLAVYGAGTTTGTGGVFANDPGLPKQFSNTLYTSNRLTNEITRHRLVAKGASFEVRSEAFVSVPHPVDMSMDGQSTMFIASSYGGDGTYDGDSVGYIVRVGPKRTATPKFIDITTLTNPALRAQLASVNAEYRLQVQREMLRRGPRAGVVAGLQMMIADKRRPTYGRVAAIFTLTQLIGDKARPIVSTAARDPALRAFALRALADNRSELAGLTPTLFVKALQDTDAAVQVAAIAALVRLNATESDAAIVPLTASTDPTVAHIAVNALVLLNASAATLQSLNGANAAERAGALRALERMHDTSVVNALVNFAAISSKTGLDAFNDESAVIHTDVLAALSRLYFRESEWNGEWWGPRPNSRGPYFAAVPWEGTARLRPILAAAANAQRADAANILKEYERNGIVPPGTRDLVLGTRDELTRKALLTLLVGAPQINATVTTALRQMFEKSSSAERDAIERLIAAQSSATLPQSSRQ